MAEGESSRLAAFMHWPDEQALACLPDGHNCLRRGGKREGGNA
jgi:hypothetical protein